MNCNGIKISSLENKDNITGSEYFVIQDDADNYKVSLNDINTYLNEKNNIQAEVKEVTSTVVASANVIVEDNTLKFSFGLPKGEKGDKGEKGEPGQNGIDSESKTIFGFTSTDDDVRPNRPEGGYWDNNSNTMVYPEGWGSNDELDGIVWMSNVTLGNEGSPITLWSIPVRVTGKDGNDGVDGTSIEFRYKRTATMVTPSNPGNVDTEQLIQLGWLDHPQGVSSSYPCEYVISRTLTNDVWSSWQGPVLWSKYGANGKDGDGIEYIYTLTSTNIAPTIVSYDNGSSEAQKDGYIPEQGSNENPWTDNPTGIDSINKWEWVSIRRKYGQDNEHEEETTRQWEIFETPVLWARYGDTGSNGLMLYPAGKYPEEDQVTTSDKTYVNDGKRAPYLLDTADNNYYYLSKQMTWVVRDNSTYRPSSSDSWTKIDSFEAIYTKIGIVDNGTIGDAVFNGNYMFSKQGINKEGEPVGGDDDFSWQEFNHEDPYSDQNNFRPNLCINFNTGELKACTGKVSLSSDENSSEIKFTNETGVTLPKEGDKLTKLSLDDGLQSYIYRNTSELSKVYQDYMKINYDGIDSKINDKQLLYNQDKFQIGTSNGEDGYNPMFVINNDGSGQMANGNITWNASGNVKINGYLTSNDATDLFNIHLPFSSTDMVQYTFITTAFSGSYYGHNFTADYPSRITLYRSDNTNETFDIQTSSSATIELEPTSVYYLTTTNQLSSPRQWLLINLRKYAE